MDYNFFTELSSKRQKQCLQKSFLYEVINMCIGGCGMGGVGGGGGGGGVLKFQ